MEERMDRIEQRMDSMEERMDRIEQRMDRIETVQKTMQEEQQRMYMSISEMMETMIEKSEQRMKKYMDDIKHELTARMDKIESIVSDTRDRVSNIEVYVVGMDKRVKKLERSGYYKGGCVSDKVADFINGSDEE